MGLPYGENFDNPNFNRICMIHPSDRRTDGRAGDTHYSIMLSRVIKLQLNNAAGGRLYFTRPHIPEAETKQNCRQSL